MTYITGTIPGGSNPSLDLYTAMVSSLTAAGLTLVDTVVISTRTHKIWKSPTASNLYGDFYYDIAYYTTGAGDLSILPFEGYNAATDSGIRGPVSGSSNTFTPETTFYSQYGATEATLEAANWKPNAATAGGLFITTNTLAFGYWISITANRIIAITSIAPTKLYFCGFYEPDARHAAHAGAYLFPLVATKLDVNGASESPGGLVWLNRFPKITSGALDMRRYFIPGNGLLLYSNWSPPVPSGTVQAAYQLGGLVGWPVPISYHFQYAALGNIGTLRDVLMVPADSTVVRGDTVTIGADSWVLTTNIGGQPYTNASMAFRAI